MTAPAQRRWLVVVALVLAAASTVLPLLGLPAMITVLLVGITQQGRTRLLVALVGGVLATVGVGRFVVEEAVPGIVQGGQRSAEEKAVSRLREIYWAEHRARELKLKDVNANGEHEFVPMSQLTDPASTGGNILLSPVAYKPLRDDVYQAEGYAYRVFIPVEPAEAERHFIAYAWPMFRGSVGYRAFMLDEKENVCETPNTQGYTGAEKIPDAFAALSETRYAAPRCENATDKGAWKPWKKKALKPVE